MHVSNLRSHALLLVGGVVMLATAAPATACGRWCDDQASGYRRPIRVYGSYGYRATLPPRPRPLTRAQIAATPPPPGGSTTLDPPGLMTTQGILESPVPSTRPALFGSSSPVYGYSAYRSAPRLRRRR